MHTRFVQSQLAEARSYHERGLETRALEAFANAAHAIHDSFSPAHNDNGQPRVYRDTILPSLFDAIVQGHTPFEGVGHEGMDDLTPEARAEMVRQTEAAFNSVFGNAPEEKELKTCPGSRILRESC